ncbi:unnamed protein product [Parnassius apollo]|uniref:(apollo) hypothetical protein n=1 Tax=Parnassius apollo TaxID=110799 RepID=A0A8S3WLZ5_PARAO|nr:unnamed protein product [Parnassius apollo]
MVAVSEIKKHWDFSDKVMSEISSLNPKLALSSDHRENKLSIVPLATILPRIITHNTATGDGSLLQSLDDQWQNLPLRCLPDDITQEKEVDLFWSKLLTFENLCGEKEFTVLAQFALDVLCIPYANADCERIFSKINLIKTKSRNRILTNTINNVVIASDSAKHLEKGCISFEPTRQMANKIVSNVLYATTSLQSNPSTSTRRDFELEEEDAFEFFIPD